MQIKSIISYNLYVSVLMYSITWLTPICNWSAIGGTHGLPSIRTTLLCEHKSKWPISGGRTLFKKSKSCSTAYLIIIK